MFTIARLTHRYYYGKRPHECKDNVVGYYSDIEKARAAAKYALGEGAKVNNDFGFDVWASPHLPHTEYIIDLIEIW